MVGNPKFDLTAAQQKTAIAQLRAGATGTGARQTAPASGPQASNAGESQLASRGGDLKGGDLPPLPGTQVEVDAVDKLLKAAGWQATEYTGDLAVKDAVTQAHAPRVVRALAAAGWPASVLINVNFPNLPPDQVGPVQIARQGRRKIGDQLGERLDLRGEHYYWIGPMRTEEPTQAGTDLAAVNDGRIAVTPLHLDLTHGRTAKHLERALS